MKSPRYRGNAEGGQFKQRNLLLKVPCLRAKRVHALGNKKTSPALVACVVALKLRTVDNS